MLLVKKIEIQQTNQPTIQETSKPANQETNQPTNKCQMKALQFIKHNHQI
tara:strand:+ start:677 stop:826 length:150 start_codon:yes stop_codon:yes gene_type:complete